MYKYIKTLENQITLWLRSNDHKIYKLIRKSNLSFSNNIARYIAIRSKRIILDDNGALKLSFHFVKSSKTVSPLPIRIFYSNTK